MAPYSRLSGREYVIQLPVQNLDLVVVGILVILFLQSFKGNFVEDFTKSRIPMAFLAHCVPIQCPNSHVVAMVAAGV